LTFNPWTLRSLALTPCPLTPKSANATSENHTPTPEIQESETWIVKLVPKTLNLDPETLHSTSCNPDTEKNKPVPRNPLPETHESQLATRSPKTPKHSPAICDRRFRDPWTVNTQPSSLRTKV